MLFAAVGPAHRFHSLEPGEHAGANTGVDQAVDSVLGVALAIEESGNRAWMRLLRFGSFQISSSLGSFVTSCRVRSRLAAAQGHRHLDRLGRCRPANVDLLPEHQSFLDDEDFLDDRNDGDVALGPDWRCCIDLPVDLDPADRNVVALESCGNQFLAGTVCVVTRTRPVRTSRF